MVAGHLHSHEYCSPPDRVRDMDSTDVSVCIDHLSHRCDQICDWKQRKEGRVPFSSWFNGKVHLGRERQKDEAASSYLGRLGSRIKTRSKIRSRSIQSRAFHPTPPLGGSTSYGFHSLSDSSSSWGLTV